MRTSNLRIMFQKWKAAGRFSPVEDFLHSKNLYAFTKTVEKKLSWSFWELKQLLIQQQTELVYRSHFCRQTKTDLLQDSLIWHLLQTFLCMATLVSFAYLAAIVYFSNSSVSHSFSE